jgi:hypothetical protein
VAHLMGGGRGRRGRRRGGPPSSAGAGVGRCCCLGSALAAHGKVGVLLLAMVVVSVQLLGPAAAVGRGRRLIAPASSDAGGWRIWSRGV